MNREEILAKSQKENKNQLDERSKSIQTKANSISQGVGMVMCILLGAIGMGARRDHAFLFLALALYWCMFAAERLACAAMEKNKGQWILAAVITVGAVGGVVAYFLALFDAV